MPLAFDQPARPKERTALDVLLDIESLLTTINENTAPGIRGIEGTEAIPELVIRQFAIDERFQITGNRRRKKLTIKCVTGAIELRDSTALDLTGWSLAAGESFAIEHATNSVYLVPVGGPATVQTCEESS